MSKALSKAALTLLPSLLMFPLIYWLQVLVGHEVALFPLYLIPVSLLTLQFGPVGLALSSVAATICWIWANISSGKVYSHEWLRIYNGISRGVVYLFMGSLILAFRRTVAVHRERMEAMRSLLHICHGCGAIQGGDGEWVPAAKLSAAHSPRHVAECHVCSRTSDDVQMAS